MEATHKHKMLQPIEMIQKMLPAILFVAISIVVTILNPIFFTWDNISNILMQYSGVAFIAIGAMMVLVSGGIDFTSAEVMACGSVIGGLWYLQSGNQVLFLILGCITIGLMVGLANGVLIAYIKFPPFIATLAMQSIVHGIMLFFAEGNIIQLSGPTVEFLGKGRIAGIPVAFLVLVVFTVIMWLVTKRTKLGTYTYALGGNEQALTYTGVNVKKYKIMIYMSAGLCSALGTILITTRMAAIYSSVNSTLLLDGVAAAVIGGTSVTGGKGTVIGTVIGAMIIGVISNSLILLNVSANMHDVVKGCIIIFALLIDVLVNRKSKRD